MNTDGVILVSLFITSNLGFPMLSRPLCRHGGVRRLDHRKSGVAEVMRGTVDLEAEAMRLDSSIYPARTRKVG